MTPPEGIAAGANRTDRQLIGTVAAAAYVAVVALCFAYFFPIFVGQLITYDSWSARMWLGSRWI
jgi:dolichyl-phosphate-mannose--protein O-mannosyl transferase